MSDKGEKKDSDLALLADLVGGIEPTDPRFARSEALLADAASRAELDEHRRLVALLKEHAPPAANPNWHALEASIRRACEAEKPAPRSWLRWLRWPVLALGVAAAALALARLRTEAPDVKPPEVAKADARPSGLVTSARHDAPSAPSAHDAPSAPSAHDAPSAPSAPSAPDTPSAHDAPDLIAAWAALPDEAGWLDRAEGLSEGTEEVLPRAAAITLGLAEEESLREEGAELGFDVPEPGEPWLEELQQLDGESLRRLDAWLDSAKQKG